MSEDQTPGADGGRLTARVGDVRAWLIEETWSGCVHYVSRDFDQVKLATEWRQNAWRRSYGARARNAVPIVTKNIAEARTFPTQAKAELWLSFQPRFMNCTDQYQVREHMWPAGRAALETSS